MKFLRLFFRKTKKPRRLSDFESAKTRGGFKHSIYDFKRNACGSIWQVTGVVLFEGLRIFVVWDACGQAYVVRNRDEKFDLLF